jgi:oxygen-independent coproporphyrinogen-3 oxidase
VSCPVGIYLAIPFCKAKCSFCNFASDAFGPDRMGGYVDRLCREIREARSEADRIGAVLPADADSVYFGGGTPSLLSGEQFRQIFSTLRNEFNLSATAEITVECAPGQLSEETLEELQGQGMNRISLGVQTFVDREARAVGRLHTGAECEAEIGRLQQAGINKVGMDLIAGLPFQTEASWRESVDRAVSSGVGHVSIYMLEVDEESRLGREALAGGRRYGAAELPADDLVADWYGIGCEVLNHAGVRQYEISNFAREGEASRHNVKYWRRLPYVGFGLDAHSMLAGREAAVRFQNPDDLDAYMAAAEEGPFRMAHRGNRETEWVGKQAAFEESLFLGLRLVEGVRLGELREAFGDAMLASVMPSIADACDAGLLVVEDDRIRLTADGRLVSNEVFSRLLIADAA